jgi:hypothetical protein
MTPDWPEEAAGGLGAPPYVFARGQICLADGDTLDVPLLAFYRSQHVNQKWLAALTAIVDVATFIRATVPDKAPPNRTPPARIIRIV